MRRAVVIFIEKKRHLMLQFGLLYTSYKYINSPDTDLVVFGTDQALKLIPSDCIRVKCDPLSGPLWQDYRFMNSISCLVSTHSDFLEDYDLLLRTDIDTFLTPAWNSYYPALYSVGKGSYVNDIEVKNNLLRVASKLGLQHRGYFNLGSTHYGSPSLMREVCQLSLDIAEYLLKDEFADQEGSWPGWYRGVTSMYSCELAVNHLVDEIKKDSRNLDFDSTSEASIYKHAHIHCWHTSSMFSKFAYEDGKYDRLTTAHLNTEQINYYCLDIALKAKELLPWLDTL